MRTRRGPSCEHGRSVGTGLPQPPACAARPTHWQSCRNSSCSAMAAFELGGRPSFLSACSGSALTPARVALQAQCSVGATATAGGSAKGGRKGARAQRSGAGAQGVERGCLCVRTPRAVAERERASCEWTAKLRRSQDGSWATPHGLAAGSLEPPDAPEAAGRLFLLLGRLLCRRAHPAMNSAAPGRRAQAGGRVPSSSLSCSALPRARRRAVINRPALANWVSQSLRRVWQGCCGGGWRLRRAAAPLTGPHAAKQQASCPAAVLRTMAAMCRGSWKSSRDCRRPGEPPGMREAPTTCGRRAAAPCKAPGACTAQLNLAGGAAQEAVQSAAEAVQRAGRRAAAPIGMRGPSNWPRPGKDWALRQAGRASQTRSACRASQGPPRALCTHTHWRPTTPALASGHAWRLQKRVRQLVDSVGLLPELLRTLPQASNSTQVPIKAARRGEWAAAPLRTAHLASSQSMCGARELTLRSPRAPPAAGC